MRADMERGAARDRRRERVLVGLFILTALAAALLASSGEAVAGAPVDGAALAGISSGVVGLGEEVDGVATLPPELSLAVRRSAFSGVRVGAPEGLVWLGSVHKIVIDPGHGGRNEGAVGVGHVHEKHLTLPIALHFADRLRATYPDVEIVMTRYSDSELGLSERVELANQAGADLFVSIHLNAAGNPEAAGFETFWVRDASPVLPRETPMLQGMLEVFPRLPQLCRERGMAAQEARAFAEEVQRAMSERLSVPNRGVKQGNYTVLRRAHVPAVVVELGFLTHGDEGMSVLAPAYQARLVDGLVSAVARYDAQLTARRQETLAMD